MALTVGGSLMSAALAGCLSASDGDTTNSLSVGDSSSVGEGRVTVQRISTRQMLAVLKAGTHTEIYGEPETQYVRVDVETDGVEESIRTVRESMSLSLDSTEYDIVEKYLTRNMDEKNTVSIAFPVSADISASDGAVVWNDESGDIDASWTLPEDTRESITSPPVFRVDSFSVPETVTEGSSIEATIEVTNAGESNGAFLAEVGTARASDQSEIDFEVPIGETVTQTKSVSIVGGAGDDETIVLDWGKDTQEQTVSIEG